jgi:acyl carrier protein
MIEDESIERQIITALISTLNLSIAPEEIGENDLLFCGELGMDSIVALEIVAAIEKRFGITVADDEINAELFESVASLSTYVKKRLGIKSR